MDKTDLLVGLDIGTTSVKAVVADTASNEMQIIGAANGPTKGMRHGKIVDIDQTAESISAVLKKVAQKTNSKIYRVVTGIPVGLLQLENAVGLINIEENGREVRACCMGYPRRSNSRASGYVKPCPYTAQTWYPGIRANPCRR